MSDRAQWWRHVGETHFTDGLIPVDGYVRDNRSPEEVAMMEKAAAYGAHSVFFEAGRNERPAVAQAFIFVDDGPENNPLFGEKHRQLWSWGGVPLIYRKTPSVVQLFRCAHAPDFVSESGKELVCNPIETLNLAAAISNDPWWDAERLRNGTIWDDTQCCKRLLSAKKAAHKSLIEAIKRLSEELNAERILPEHLRRKLLILSLLIAYLEERGVFEADYFGRFLRGATSFFEVLANGKALIALLEALEERFNGNVFTLSDEDSVRLKDSGQLTKFAKLIRGREEKGGQLTLWKLYSFKDLPVELISHIYQLFVKDADTSVYTPPFLVRLMLEESLSWDRLDRIIARDEIILDPSCGSGVFLVEAYKRIVRHWRSRNGWKQPTQTVLKALLQRVHGIDLEPGAVELAAFSLCLALCDALEPETIRASIKLFPPLAGITIHRSCFFEAKETGLIKKLIGAVVGNPPFESSLSTEGTKRSYARYTIEHGTLPDKQVAYLFLHDAMSMIAEGGALCLLQQYNFLYNQQSLGFRRKFIETWDVREVLDFISVRGLFHKGGADTKVVVVIAEASKAPQNRRILHATFRRSGRVDAEQGFDIDGYDLHWLPRELALDNDGVWRTDLFGGGRVLGYVDRLKKLRTLEMYAKERGWDYGEGFIEGGRGIARPSKHIVGKPLLRSHGLTSNGIDVSAITTAPNKPYEGPRSERRFSPPLLLIRENMDLQHDVWLGSYLTYTQQIVGFSASKKDVDRLKTVDSFLSKNTQELRSYIALISPRLFIQKATALQADDIFSLPYPEDESLDLSENEKSLATDIVSYYRDLVRLGEDSAAMKQSGHESLDEFNAVFTRQINTIYKKNPLRSLAAQSWPGMICQPFVFGKGKVDWTGAEELRGKLDTLLKDKRSESLHVTRIARMYDDKFIFLLKPDRLRYWLKSMALRDSDETLAELRDQGF